jgi:uncharacterized protein (TIGR02996 family)
VEALHRLKAELRTPIAKGHSMTRHVYRRIAPDPLPIEPYFRKLPGSEVFLHAIAEEPLEDIHRLALADWLEEHGQTPRAEFIRAQCQLEQIRYGHALYWHILDQARRLYRQHRKEWGAGLPAYRNVRWTNEDNFVRGLLERVSSYTRMSQQSYEVLFGNIDLRGFRLYPWRRQQMIQFLELPWLSRLVSLSLSLYRHRDSSLPERDLLQAKASALTGLNDLTLHNYQYDDHDLITFLESLDLPQLSRLDLTGHLLGEGGARALARCPALGHVRELNLSLYRISPSEMRPLAESPSLAKLQGLGLSFCRLAAPTVEALAGSPALSGVRSLRLHHNHLATAAIKALAGSPLLRGLSSLVLSTIDLRRDGVRALARSSGTKGLRLLSLTHNEHIGYEGIRALEDSSYLTSLEVLDLSYVPMGKKAVDALAHAPALAKVTALSLRGNRLGDAATELAASPYLHRLSFLDLRSNKLSRNARKVVRKRWPFALM